MSDKADQRIAELEQELRGVQEMLAFVLYAVAEPVVVSKVDMKSGLPSGAEIRIDDSIEEDAFVFSLAVPSAEQ